MFDVLACVDADGAGSFAESIDGAGVDASVGKIVHDGIKLG